MAREFGRTKKDEMLLRVLRAAGQTSQPSGKGAYRPVYGLPPFGSSIHDTRRQQRDNARYQASVDRTANAPVGLPVLPTNEEERDARRSVLINAMAAFGRPDDGKWSKAVIDEGGRADLYAPAVKPLMTETTPMAPRDPYYADYEFDDPEETPEEQARLAKKWNTAFEDHERDMQLQGEMSMGPLTIDDRKEPGPLEKAITDSLKKKKK